MKTHTITTYGIMELSDEAFRHAIDSNRDWNMQDDWWQPIIEDWKEKLEGMGYTSPEINFTGFYSQGDGASFESGIDLVKWLNGRVEAVKLKYAPLMALIEEGEVTASVIRTSHQYSHEHTCSVRVEDTCMLDNTETLDLIADLEEAIESERLDLCGQIYKELEKEENHLTTEEAICESMEATEAEFLEDGTLYTL